MKHSWWLQQLIAALRCRTTIARQQTLCKQKVTSCGREELSQFIVDFHPTSTWLTVNVLLGCTVNVLCVQTPVNDVKEQICQGKQDSGVRVDHVAVAHDEAHVVF